MDKDSLIETDYLGNRCALSFRRDAQGLRFWTDKGALHLPPALAEAVEATSIKALTRKREDEEIVIQAGDLALSFKRQWKFGKNTRLKCGKQVLDIERYTWASALETCILSTEDKFPPAADDLRLLVTGAWGEFILASEESHTPERSQWKYLNKKFETWKARLDEQHVELTIENPQQHRFTTPSPFLTIEEVPNGAGVRTALTQEALRPLEQKKPDFVIHYRASVQHPELEKLVGALRESRDRGLPREPLPETPMEF